MANVMFKRGSQSALQGLIDKKSFTEGTFYLTTDSDRLYFAQSDSGLVHLNHNVIHVSGVSSLPTLSKLISTFKSSPSGSTQLIVPSPNFL